MVDSSVTLLEPSCPNCGQPATGASKYCSVRCARVVQNATYREAHRGVLLARKRAKYATMRASRPARPRGRPRKVTPEAEKADAGQ